MSRQEQHNTKIMLEHASVGMGLFDAHNLCLIEANTLYMTLMASLFDSPQKCPLLIGQSLLDWEYTDSITNIIAIFRTVTETGVPYHSDAFVFRSPKRGLTYWNWTLDPAYDSAGQLTHLVHTSYEVTSQVQARQYAEQATTTLSQTNSIVEAERARLTVIETVARSVRESLDTERIGKIAIEAISTSFDTVSACLHTANHTQRVLKLLYAYNLFESDEHALKVLESIPYENLTLTKQAVIQSDPIVAEDLQEIAEKGLVDKNNPIVRAGIRGYICMPLWFGDHFEGTITATFLRRINAEGPEVRAIAGSGTHIASALAHARLHATVESEQSRLRAILDQLPEGILIAEVSNGSISYANPVAAHILGIPSEEITRTPLHRHTWLRPYIDTTLDGYPIPPWNFVAIRALCGETIKGKETTVIKPDGSKLVTLASGAPLYTESGLMTGAVIVFQDVTAQKSLEQHKNDFFSIANHELRTPITVIQGFAEILQLKATQGQPLDKLTQYALTSISEQSQHLTHLIEEMLDISSIEQAQFTLRCATCDLIATLKRVMENQTVTARQHHLCFSLEGLESTETLLASIDEDRMIQVFSNLIHNAIKYSAAGSHVEVGIRYAPEKPLEALLWVKDQGIGISPDDIPHIFKRFHRARNIDRSHSGFGIGLYLVKEVVVRHKGRVWVESTEGKGSTFFITLPLTHAQ